MILLILIRPSSTVAWRMEVTLFFMPNRGELMVFITRPAMPISRSITSAILDNSGSSCCIASCNSSNTAGAEGMLMLPTSSWVFSKLSEQFMVALSQPVLTLYGANVPFFNRG